MAHKTQSDIVRVHFLAYTLLITTIGKCDSVLVLREVLIWKLLEDGNFALVLFRSPIESNLHWGFESLMFKFILFIFDRDSWGDLDIVRVVGGEESKMSASHYSQDSFFSSCRDLGLINFLTRVRNWGQWGWDSKVGYSFKYT